MLVLIVYTECVGNMFQQNHSELTNKVQVF